MTKYNYLVVGAGLFGSIFAYKAHRQGKRVLVVDKRSHIGGNVYTEKVEGIDVHRYGAHIFHTNDLEVWNFIRRFGEFNNFVNSPVANFKGKLYNLPFNMNTFHELWGVITPAQALAKIQEQRGKYAGIKPKNLEEQALSLVGEDIYRTLIQGYTEKQWGRKCTELPAFIIKRLPVRLTFDNNYFNARYQGIPVKGYTALVERMLEGIEVRLNTDYLQNRKELEGIAEKIIFTGPIDAYYDYRFGALPYRSIRLETETLDCDNYQGVAVVNYTEKEIPYTRIIEHKHFEFGMQKKTVISREYPSEWHVGEEPFYPVNTEESAALYEKYRELSENDGKVIFGGRLGQYCYFDMDRVILEALILCEQVLQR